jgi:hypothetical protein
MRLDHKTRGSGTLKTRVLFLFSLELFPTHDLPLANIDKPLTKTKNEESVSDPDSLILITELKIMLDSATRTQFNKPNLIDQF